MTLEIRNLSKRVGADIHIHDTSLVLLAGHFNVLLGATNTGKTTLMKLMAGLDQPTSGQVLIHGLDVTRRTTQERQVSFVHQFFVNYPHLSVFDNIASPLRLAKISQQEIVRRVNEVADLLKLTPLLNRRPQELSGGQQQRVMIAMAISCKPSLLIADEPTTALDVTVQQEILKLLLRLSNESNMGVIFVSHNLGVVQAVSERIAVMHNGQIVELGPTSQIIDSPTVAYTKELIGANPSIPSEQELSRLLGTRFPTSRGE